MISYKQISETLQTVVPKKHFNIFMEKSSFMPGDEQLRLEDARIQKGI